MWSSVRGSLPEDSVSARDPGRTFSPRARGFFSEDRQYSSGISPAGEAPSSETPGELRPFPDDQPGVGLITRVPETAVGIIAQFLHVSDVVALTKALGNRAARFRWHVKGRRVIKSILSVGRGDSEVVASFQRAVVIWPGVEFVVTAVPTRDIYVERALSLAIGRTALSVLIPPSVSGNRDDYGVVCVPPRSGGQLQILTDTPTKHTPGRVLRMRFGSGSPDVIRFRHSNPDSADGIAAIRVDGDYAKPVRTIELVLHYTLSEIDKKILDGVVWFKVIRCPRLPLLRLPSATRVSVFTTPSFRCDAPRLEVLSLGNFQHLQNLREILPLGYPESFKTLHLNNCRLLQIPSTVRVLTSYYGELVHTSAKNNVEEVSVSLAQTSHLPCLLKFPSARKIWFASSSTAMSYVDTIEFVRNNVLQGKINASQVVIKHGRVGLLFVSTVDGDRSVTVEAFAYRSEKCTSVTEKKWVPKADETWDACVERMKRECRKAPSKTTGQAPP